MATRKTPKFDPVAVTASALKAVRCASDYHTIEGAADPDVLASAWRHLTKTEQEHITCLVKSGNKPQPQAIASELAACGTLIQLQATKSAYGDVAVKTAWKLLPKGERDRLTSICKTEQPATYNTQPEHLDASQIPTTYPENVGKVNDWLEKEGLADPQTPHPKRTLFSISDDLEKLNDLLDEVGDDAQQQELINNWLEAVGDERDKKLDGYAALISEMQARAEVRKAEARRLMELAASDENRARLLKERLKSFFQLHDLKTINTDRYRLSLAKNGGRAPLILDDSIPVAQLPEQFQKVSIDADTAKIREALEAGESLEWARIGERGESIRIK